MCVVIGYFVGDQPMRKFVAHTCEVQKNCTRSRALAAGVVCTQRGGGVYTSLWVIGRLICTTAFSFLVKLLALQFSHIHMCTAQQET